MDDDELILDSFSMIFTDLGYEVVTCSEGAKAVEEATGSEFDLLLSDIRMPGLNGAQVVQAIKSKKPNAKIYMITAYPGDALVQAALDAGAEGVMKKPFDIAKVLDLMRDEP